MLLIAYFLDKELLEVRLTHMELGFVFTQNPLKASNTAMHGPFQVVNPHGKVVNDKASCLSTFE